MYYLFSLHLIPREWRFFIIFSIPFLIGAGECTDTLYSFLDNTYKSYRKTLDSYPPLSKEEEKQLFEEFEKTRAPNIREKLINHNLRLVFFQAKKFQYSNREFFSDIIQEGTEGLIKAVDAYEVSKGYAFSTYAFRSINNSIVNFINGSGSFRPVVLGNIVRQSYYYAILKAVREADGKEFTPQVYQKIMEKYNIRKERVRSLVEAISGRTKSLDSEEEGAIFTKKEISKISIKSFEKDFMRDEDLKILREGRSRFLQQLSTKHQDIFKSIFLDKEDAVNYDDKIRKKYNMSKYTLRITKWQIKQKFKVYMSQFI